MPSGFATRFPASYDTATKIVSAVAFTVLLIGASAVHNFAVACLALAIFAVGYAYSPREYVISNNTITVKRFVGDVRIPLEGVREARAITKDDLRGCIRLWGSGGLFGYYGLFRTRTLGICTWYVTNRKQAVVVRTAAKTLLFSPDDKDGFLSALQEAAPTGAVFTPQPFAGIEPSRSRMPTGILLGIAIAILAAGFASWAIFYAPGPPAYTLTRETLTIHDKFYPVTVQAYAVDVAHIHVVDLADEPDWRPVARTNGFANSHYRSGWFRAANGSTMRLYQADGHRLVLLPPYGNGVAILYQARKPDEFVHEIMKQWGSRP